MRLPFANRRAHLRPMGLNVSWLDIKLGVRMFAKYPGLSFVSVLGLAIAIAIGAGVFGMVSAVLDPVLPLSGGDRIVAVQTLRADVPGNTDLQVLQDFVTWRNELTMVRDLGAFQLDERNLIVGDAVTDVVPVAEMSASGFRVARTLPLMGRVLVEDDDRVGQPSVLVIGQREWQRYFDGDPKIIGRTVRVGAMPYTVVGVMPKDFRFPRNHGFWVPLRLEPSNYDDGDGPPIEVFGRLADGVTLEQARAQVTTIERRLASAAPMTHEYRRPTILPFARASSITAADSTMEWQLYLLQLGVSLLLAVVAVNVGALVYARTATRATEIAVRTALGASRARVVTQLFVEALVISAVAAVIGLSLAAVALRWVEGLLAQGQDGIPFWFHLGLSPALIAYVTVLALVGGTVVGVLPGLRATRRAYGNLQQLASRGSSMKLGATWTALIVAQVAITVAILPAAVHHASVLLRAATVDAGYPAEQFLRARISVARGRAPSSAEALVYNSQLEARFRNGAEALLQRIIAEPGVSVSFVSAFPGGEPDRRFEILRDSSITNRTTGAREKISPVRASVTSSTTGLFDLFDAPLVAGRKFVEAESSDSTAVIVDTAFAARMPRGNVVGQYIHSVASRGAPAGPWLEIVGVVADPPRTSTDTDDIALPNVYFATTPARLRADGLEAMSIRLRMRVRNGLTPAFSERLRAAVVAIDPNFQLQSLQRDSEVLRSQVQKLRTFAFAIAATTMSVLLLSAAGIYAMLSFTVAQRRREIGVRVALGANSRSVVRSIFARASAQLGAGVGIGLILAFAFEIATEGQVMGGAASGAEGGLRGPVIVMPIVGAIVMLVGLLAALGPARRGLSVQPIEALRSD